MTEDDHKNKIYTPYAKSYPSAEEALPTPGKVVCYPSTFPDLPDVGDPANRPDGEQLIRDQDDDILLAMLLWGEARGEIVVGKWAVAQVVANRVRSGGWFGRGWESVMLKPWQFSCFNPSDPNRKKLFEPLKWASADIWQTCLYIARLAVLGKLPDIVPGCRWYHAASLKKVPKFFSKLEVYQHIGNHIFYRKKKEGV